MSDMSAVIVPRSDQINADDLLSGPITIKIKSVKVTPGTEQPVSIYFEGSEKAYRCCKSMARVLVSAWGPDSSKYVGRSLTLYCDPKVKWGGMEVGGIRISHMSDIKESLTMALTVTRANKKPFTVRPLTSGAQSQKTAAQQEQPVKSPVDSLTASTQQGATQVATVRDVPAAAAAPSDDDIAASIKTLIAGGDFDLADDLSRSIKDEARRAKAIEYIGKQREKAA